MSVAMTKRGRKLTRIKVLVFPSHLYHDVAVVLKSGELYNKYGRIDIINFI